MLGRCICLDAHAGQEVKIMSDTPDTIRAKILRYLDRNGISYPRHESVEKVVTHTGIAASDEGEAKELAHQMARDDSFPVRYRHIDSTICLEIDSQRWVASRIRSLDPEVMTWDQKQRL